jgi:hypothetical protein
MHALKRAGIAWAIGVLVLGLTVVFVGAHSAHGATKNPHHEEQDGCDHGNTGKACRPDPSPHGKDCDKHGKHGGINEDHCKAGVTPTPTPTVGPTPSHSPSPHRRHKPRVFRNVGPLAHTGLPMGTIVFLSEIGVGLVLIGLIMRKVKR